MRRHRNLTVQQHGSIQEQGLVILYPVVLIGLTAGLEYINFTNMEGTTHG